MVLPGGSVLGRSGRVIDVLVARARRHHSDCDLANRDQNRDILPTVIATLMVVQAFFLLLMIAEANPFATFRVNEPRSTVTDSNRSFRIRR